MTIFVKNDKINTYTKTFFKDYIVSDIDFTKVKPNDIFFIEPFDLEYVMQNVNPTYKLIFFLYLNHEFLHPNNRNLILQQRNKNHIIFFITTHLDNKTINNDLSFNTKCLSFNIYFNSIPTTFNNRTKKLNFFNRSANLFRLKVFEILSKRNIKLKDCYYTMANLIVRGVYPNGKIPTTIQEFVDIRNNKTINIDINYIEKHKNEFELIGDRNYFEFGNYDELVLWNDSSVNLNEKAMDSYFAFVIEGMDDTGEDLRITEKTIRALLHKNIFLSVQCRGFNDSLRRMGIETFEDVFGLEYGWDNSDDEYKIEIFVNCLEKINNMSLDEIKKIYNRNDVQNRLETNYQIISKALMQTTSYNEINNVIDKIIKKKTTI